MTGTRIARTQSETSWRMRASCGCEIGALCHGGAARESEKTSRPPVGPNNDRRATFNGLTDFLKKCEFVAGYLQSGLRPVMYMHECYLGCCDSGRSKGSRHPREGAGNAGRRPDGGRSDG